MMQNHLLQLLCLIAMEPPVTFDAGPVRDEKNKVMHAIRPIEPARVSQSALRGQYGPGFAEGKPVPGYRQEKGVAPDSKTETYAALRLLVDNWRWAGVPFYLRTGKRLAKRVSEIAIRFHRTPHLIFHRSPTGVEASSLVIRIQPDEGMALTVAAKTPGPDWRLGPVRLDFRYGEVFGGEPPEAYERLLLDAIHGDATLYAPGDWVEKAWQLLGPVLDVWGEAPGPPLYPYEAGSWGPAEADAFIARDGGAWRRPYLIRRERARGLARSTRGRKGAACRDLDVGEKPEQAFPDADLERAPRLLVDLGGAAVLHARAADVSPAVGLERRAQRGAEAPGFEPAAIDQTGRLDRGRLDDRRLLREVREPPREGDVFELAPDSLGGCGARAEKQQGEQRAKEFWESHGPKPSRRAAARQKDLAGATAPG